MRITYRDTLKNHFYPSWICAEDAQRLTQPQPADTLAMNNRSYMCLDHRTACSIAAMLALFLVYVCDNLNLFVEGLRHAFETRFDEAA